MDPAIIVLLLVALSDLIKTHYLIKSISIIEALEKENDSLKKKLDIDI